MGRDHSIRKGTDASTSMGKHNQEHVPSQLPDGEVDIVMPVADWDAFCAALDAPTQSIPALKQLFAKPGVFEELRLKPPT